MNSINLRVVYSVASIVALSAFASPSAAADGVAGQFQQWSSSTMVSRQVSLRDLGFKQPVVLNGRERQQEIYLPVPAGVATYNAQLQLDARYVRGHSGRTSALWSIDGDPIAARLITDAQGDASQHLGIDGEARSNGFVRAGIGWWSVVSDNICADQSAPANVLRLSPDSMFSYQVNGRDLDTVAKMWGALPQHVKLLVEGKAVQRNTFDTAWRVGTVFRTAGKSVDVVALPAVGEHVDLNGVSVPLGLRGIPAYAAIASGGSRHTIASLAEVGALLSLRDQGPLAVDVVVGSAALNKAVKAAMDALDVQVAATGNEAKAAFANWRAVATSGIEKAQGETSVAATQLSGRPILLVNDGAGAKVAGLLSAQWRTYALGRNLSVQKAVQPRVDQDVVLLDRLGSGMAGTLDVVSRGDRTAVFELGVLSADGRLPEQLVVDVSAAPNAAGEKAVATLFFNDYLLGARLLSNDGHPQRLVANVPVYAIKARNEVRVSFLRQPARPYCHDPATAFPVSVLPSSHIKLAKRSMGVNFVAAANQLAQSNEVFVSTAWLKDGPAALGKVMAVASAVGVSPEQSDLQLVESGAAITPKKPYLAFALSPKGVTQAVAAQGHLQVMGRKVSLLDIKGLERSAAVQVVQAGGQIGVIYSDLGLQNFSLEEPFRLLHGDLAVLNGSGVVKEFNGEDPYGARIAEEGNPEPWWHQHMFWILLLVVVIAFMLLAARVAHVRRRRQAVAQGH